MPSRNYRDLLAWQRSMDLVVEIYNLTKSFPREEMYCLTNQLRRSAISIPSNIAEGQGRGTDPELVRHLRIGHGSLREAETQVLIGERLEYVTERQIRPVMLLSEEVGRLVNGLIRSKA